MLAAVLYPGLSPQHVARLQSYTKSTPTNWDVLGVEVFSHDSDYSLVRKDTPPSDLLITRLIDCESVKGRASIGLSHAIRKGLDNIKPDVLVVYGWGFPECRIALSWAKSHRVPVVLSSDSSATDKRRLWPVELAKRYIVCRCASAFVAGTPQARYIASLGIPNDKIFFPGPCVIDYDYWAEAAERCRTYSDTLRKSLELPDNYFLCTARFIPKKNVPFLVRSYSRYAGLVTSPWSLVLVGDGPEREQIRLEITKSRHGNIRLAGFQQIDVLPAYYGLASCFIIPSLAFEQWGLVVNEAMACGLPVLASSSVGSTEDLVMEGRNGHTFSPTDTTSLTDLMVRLSTDPESTRLMGLSSIRIARNHTLSIGANNFWKAVLAAYKQA